MIEKVDYQGLMLALRATSKVDYFDISPKRYDLSMSKCHKEFSLDPMFEVSHEARALLYEGIDARIVYFPDLNPNLAYFKVSKEQAQKELNDYSEKDELLNIANKFWENYMP